MGASCLIVFSIFLAASAWPQQTQDEIAAEAARDARIYEEMMQHDFFHQRFQVMRDEATKRNNQGACEICPSGQYFHDCNIGGMSEGHEFTCKQAFDYLHGGKSDDECQLMQGLKEKCCMPTAPDPDEKCVTPPPPPPCSQHEQEIACAADGHRPAAKCAKTWLYGSEKVTGCYDGWTKTWCSHDETYTSGSNYSTCEPCIEAVAHDQTMDKWAPAIESIRCLYAIATSGDSSERVLFMENGGPGTTNVFPVFSAGKWPATVAIAGVVHAGYMTWDTKASEVFDWWTKDAADPRSRVTLANMLNFVDGFVNIEGTFQFTNDPVAQRCLTPGFANFYTPEQCAQQIYETAHYAGVEQDTYMNATNPGAEPGTWFEYNSYHQQLALAMATKVTGMDARDLLKKYVLDPAGMKDSFWLGGSNPCLSGFLQSTTDDYDSFLRAHTGYKLIPKHIADRTETLVHGANGAKIKQYGSRNMVPFDNFAMGCSRNGDYMTMGGNTGNAINRATGHYSMIAYSGLLPYQFQVLMQVYPFHDKVEEIWKSMTSVETIVV
jgi:CubicO group peptidase (beta-lactamase class C family)|eukprot:TRINITY_DN7134_c0_g1_i1.p1 TRINITY_DN7134_c0_g1~~TRINITY_DN7134_c0_g1_i1.p1  ORF type:complete len:571 (+),score=83.75 TRINITY_DN7134_c0_g1_i1:69-1715(+)